MNKQELNCTHAYGYDSFTNEWLRNPVDPLDLTKVLFNNCPFCGIKLSILNIKDDCLKGGCSD